LEESLERWYPEHLTTGAVAQFCGVSRVTVLRWIQKGHLPAFRLPEGHYRIRKDDFSEFLTKHDIPTRRRMVGKKRGIVTKQEARK